LAKKPTNLQIQKNIVNPKHYKPKEVHTKTNPNKLLKTRNKGKKPESREINVISPVRKKY
jgi:hypothetical protein